MILSECCNVDMNRKSVKLIQFVTLFNNLSVLNINFGVEAVGAGAESRYGSGSATLVSEHSI
jgi:hypothetical protein